MLYITVDDSVVELGKSITGEIRWQSGKSSQQPLTVKVVWHLEGRGSKQKQTVATLELGKLSANSSIPFQLDLPYAAPVSFNGQLFRVIWVVLAEMPRGFLGSKTETVQIRVIPRRSHP